MGELSDPFDLIQHWNELHLEVSLKNQAAKGGPETHPAFDGLHCVDCDNDVEPERLRLQRVRCAECQKDKEREDAAVRRNGRPE